MHIKYLTLSILIASIFLCGCKVRITVPEGGEIVTESGSFSCKAGQTCNIDVVDVFFNEAFIAKPDKDKVFVAWKSGKDTLCGKSEKKCVLNTAGFKGNDTLLAVLESNDVYHLSPYFADKMQGASGRLTSKPMKSCLDPQSFNAGYHSDITTGLYNSSGKKRGNRRTQANVIGPTTYLGSSVIERYELVDQTDTLDSSYEVTTYMQVNLGKHEATLLGIDQVFLTPVAQEVESILEPGFTQRSDLQVGESHVSSYTVDTQPPNGDSKTIKSNITTEIIYEGQEKITTPAGTFEACRLHRFDTVNGTRTESYNWIGRGNSILLRESDALFNVRAEVISGSVMGKSL